VQQKTFVRNKKIYLAYNEFRKNIFSEMTPRESEVILYLLPWMLSVNNPEVPGYVPHLKKDIMVSGAARDRTLISRDPVFKKMFNIKQHGSLLKPFPQASLIQGVYTIGSSGTISQTNLSDCDIWICIEKSDFDEKGRGHLSQKVNLIKDWMDSNLKMPVYFFICDLEDIRNANFGSLDVESSGSAQRHVLKEEFYRTVILVSGKIPLWWVCYDPDRNAIYDEFAAEYAKGHFNDYDCVDMGSQMAIDSDEYFGAALWQFNKALTHPLKSVIKMLLLEMLLVAPKGELLCHRFRSLILNQGNVYKFLDPSMFTWEAVMDHKQGIDTETFNFIKACCYLRYDLKFYTKKITIKEKLAREIFQKFPLKAEETYRLNAFANWPLLEQLEFGEKIFGLLMNIYKVIKAYKKDLAGGLTRRDMTIIGRKLAVCLEKKHSKLAVVHRPVANLNLPNLTFLTEKRSWQVVTTGEAKKTVIANPDIVYCITYLVWNDMYHDLDVRMAPNPTPMTLQEINNLAKRIKELFGVFDITRVDFENFLEPEKVIRMLVIISFESSGQLKYVNDFCIIYLNHWGELFFHRFNAPEKFKAFIEGGGQKFSQTEMVYYIKRSSLYYEKIIERTKKLVTHIFAKATAINEE
jgi:adenylate cyclase class 1